MPARRHPTLLLAPAILLLSAGATAQIAGTGASLASGFSARGPQDPAAPPPVVLEPLERSVEFALSTESLWADYVSDLRRGQGYWSVGLLANEDDDLVPNARILRSAAPAPDVPLELGVGLGLYGVFLDDTDEEAGALTLCGSARYLIATAYPSSLSAQLSYAPDLTTFGDGEDFLDLRATFEVEIGPYAAAFVSYREMDMESRDGPEREIAERVHVGVRISF